MIFFISTADATAQFRTLTGPEGRIIIFVDEEFDLAVRASCVDLWQRDRHFQIEPLDVVVYLPFRAPWEGENIPHLAIIDRLELLEDGLNVCGVKLVNPPSSWRRAYLKTGLIRARKEESFKSAIPETEILDGNPPVTSVDNSKRRVVKSGYGIHRLMNGLYPQVTFLPSGHPFRAEVPYRYVLQSYLAATNEYRTYSVIKEDRPESLIFEVPTGSISHPDWRDETKITDLAPHLVKNDSVSQLASKLMTFFGLSYLCLDILQHDNELSVVDINPHGSWSWLPESGRAIVDCFMLSWLRQIEEQHSGRIS